ncbi:hypothetical protein CPB84DRAFT_1851386 [Gymnopilus junonius]|uniref:Uncharacterized protein n=1 Tax=Gymnopilus junonius TaxID=109634 RepID=A0A9P5NFC1_GYMJU|nr:hypothetical protein CPB84DRAFT_1851386 [Gymnopilus junonius]
MPLSANMPSWNSDLKPAFHTIKVHQHQPPLFATRDCTEKEWAPTRVVTNESRLSAYNRTDRTRALDTLNEVDSPYSLLNLRSSSICRKVSNDRDDARDLLKKIEKSSIIPGSERLEAAHGGKRRRVIYPGTNDAWKRNTSSELPTGMATTYKSSDSSAVLRETEDAESMAQDSFIAAVSDSPSAFETFSLGERSRCALGVVVALVVSQQVPPGRGVGCHPSFRGLERLKSLSSCWPCAGFVSGMFCATW